MFRACLSLVTAFVFGFGLAPACGGACEAADQDHEACIAVVQPLVCCAGERVPLGYEGQSCLALGASPDAFTLCEVDACAGQDPCAPTTERCAAINATLSASAFGAECSCTTDPAACPDGTYCAADGSCTEGECADDSECLNDYICSHHHCIFELCAQMAGSGSCFCDPDSKRDADWCYPWNEADDSCCAI